MRVTVINDDTLFESGQLANIDLKHLESTFENLPEDPYAPKGLRARRYSRYRLCGDGSLTHLPQKDFMQPKDINQAVGDVERHFEEIEPSLEADPGFVRMFEAFRSHTGLQPGTVVEAHQVRWHCGDKVALPAPEGTHQDGFDYIAMFMVEVENLTGGEVLVYPNLNSPPIAKRNLKTGEYVVLNDKKLFHDAAPLVPEPNDRVGHWDMIVLTAKHA
jgi:hypothetical protein